MSVLPLTPSVIQALRTDFRQGTWSATTQQFFQQLFVRVGEGTSDTNKELMAQIVALEAVLTVEQAAGAATQAALDVLEGEVEVLQDAVDVLEATVTGVEADFGVSPAVGMPGDVVRVVDLSPRLETVPDDFPLGGALWP